MQKSLKWKNFKKKSKFSLMPYAILLIILKNILKKKYKFEKQNLTFFIIVLVSKKGWQLGARVCARQQ